MEERKRIPPTVFLSHTDRSDVDRIVSTAALVELRRVGFVVWIDREHPAPPATPEQMALGPVPANPLFEHLVSAISSCDAVLYVVSPQSFDREYVRLEFDPRILFQEFVARHGYLTPAEVPFYLALAEPVPTPPPYWPSLVSVVAPGRVLNLTMGGATPLLVPAVLSSMIQELSPGYVLPLDPAAEWLTRNLLEQDASDAPGCPKDVPAPLWRRLEGLLGLGPTFPGPLSLVDERQLEYGLFRTGAVSRAFPSDLQEVQMMSTLWSANMMLRSRSLRYGDGHDLPVEYSFPHILEMSEGSDTEDPIPVAAVAHLQLGYGFLTSEVAPSKDNAEEHLGKAVALFDRLQAHPLAALADVLRNRATGVSPSPQGVSAVEGFGLDSGDKDLHRLHHGVLDMAFPGPRLEATPAYRARAQDFSVAWMKAASSLKAGFAKIGEEVFSPEFWTRRPD